MRNCWCQTHYLAAFVVCMNMCMCLCVHACVCVCVLGYIVRTKKKFQPTERGRFFEKKTQTISPFIFRLKGGKFTTRNELTLRLRWGFRIGCAKEVKKSGSYSKSSVLTKIDRQACVRVRLHLCVCVLALESRMRQPQQKQRHDYLWPDTHTHTCARTHIVRIQGVKRRRA